MHELNAQKLVALEWLTWSCDLNLGLTEFNELINFWFWSNTHQFQGLVIRDHSSSTQGAQFSAEYQALVGFIQGCGFPLPHLSGPNFIIK